MQTWQSFSFPNSTLTTTWFWLIFTRFHFVLAKDVCITDYQLDGRLNGPPEQRGEAERCLFSLAVRTCYSSPSCFFSRKVRVVLLFVRPRPPPQMRTATPHSRSTQTHLFSFLYLLSFSLYLFDSLSPFLSLTFQQISTISSPFISSELNIRFAFETCERVSFVCFFFPFQIDRAILKVKTVIREKEKVFMLRERTYCMSGSSIIQTWWTQSTVAGFSHCLPCVYVCSFGTMKNLVYP